MPVTSRDSQNGKNSSVLSTNEEPKESGQYSSTTDEGATWQFKQGTVCYCYILVVDTEGRPTYLHKNVSAAAQKHVCEMHDSNFPRDFLLTKTQTDQDEQSPSHRLLFQRQNQAKETDLAIEQQQQQQQHQRHGRAKQDGRREHAWIGGERIKLESRSI
jgi:hypothetical protein